MNGKTLRILQISDTHNRHQQLTNLPVADVIVHCGDFTENGTEEEALIFSTGSSHFRMPTKYLSQATTTFAYGMRRK